MELNKAETRIHRFIEFIAEAKATASIATALEEAETTAGRLTEELNALEQTKDEAFEPPPKEWIGHKISEVQKVLEEKTEKSALLLRKLTGKVTLTPTVPDIGKPYYHARSKLKTFALLKGSDKGSNWCGWWSKYPILRNFVFQLTPETRGVFLEILDAYRPLKAPSSSRKINPKLRQIIKSVENIIPALENGHYPLTKTVLIK